MDKDAEETNSGMKKKGTWKEVVRFGEKVEEIIKNVVNEKSAEDFKEWRPKKEEAENDMKRKTVDKAVISKNKLEEESEGVKEDLKDASEKVAKAGKKATEKKKPPAKEISEASENIAKPFYTRFAQFFRKFEAMIYSKISLRSTYYLDTDDISVDMKSKDKEYELDVNVPIEDKREKLKEEFKEDE
ncbi:MAG: hypothetical protein BRC29_01545 [Nanohaloarchaea archaeon SW_7_43_1]|nr:MAG: hypothetical protein BRC29_01545 [Nanohaloarchaea archaeon SW_7_43_1]